METIISKFSALQIWLSHRRLPISFPNTFSCLLPNIEKKVFLWMMTLSGAKIPQPSNIQQRVVAFSYQVPLSTYQPPNFFILSLHKGLVYHQLSEADLGLLQHPKWSALRHQQTLVNSWKPLTIISKRSILDVAGALDPPLVILDILLRNNSYLLGVRFLINNRVTTCPS